MPKTQPICLCSPDSGGEASIVFGSAVATRSSIEAALQYLPQSLRFYDWPDSQDSIQSARKFAERFAKRRDADAGPVSIGSRMHLHSDWRHGRIGAWFEPSGDFVAPMQVRAATAGQPVPVVSNHHSFSYAAMLHNLFLGALLAPTYPFDAFICTSRAARDAVQKSFDLVAERFARSHSCRLRFAGSLPLIPLGIDTDHFRPLAKQSARTRLAIPREKFILLYLGRVSVTDKADLLPWVVALQRLPFGARKKLEVVIAGSERPGVTAEIRAWVRKLKLDFKVRILSPVDPALRVPLYSAADVFISPADNLQETFGIAPVEAMACGLPQVVSDWDGYRDTVAHESTGFLIPTLWSACHADTNVLATDSQWERPHFLLAQSVAVDCEAFAKKIALLIESPELCNRMSTASRKRAVELYSWPAVMKQYAALFDSLMAMAAEWNRAAAPVPGVAPPYFVPDYFETYRGYASRVLDEDTPVKLARPFLSRSHFSSELPYAPLQELETAQLRAVARSLAAGVKPLSEVIADVRKNFSGSTNDSVLRHVMWLLKYGFLSVVAAD
jgi:D-inositol-3-phosphate glycosyltransferase